MSSDNPAAEMPPNHALQRTRPRAWKNPVEKHINTHVDVAALLAGGFGKLADGPEFIVAELQRVLVDTGLQTTLGAPRRVKFWEDGAWHDVVRPHWGIALGESWIVASGFEEAPLS